MPLEEQLEIIKKEFPEAWKYLHESPDLQLPEYDDNDELIVKEKEGHI